MKIALVIDNMSAGGIQASARKIIENCQGEKVVLVLRGTIPAGTSKSVKVVYVCGDSVAAKGGGVNWVRRYVLLRNALSKVSPDLVFSMGFSVNLLLVILKLLGGGKYKCVLGVRNSLAELLHTRRGFNPIRLLTPWMYKYADLILVVSKGIFSEFVSAGIPPSKLLIIYNGYALESIRNLSAVPLTDSFLLHREVPVLVTAGRLSVQKNLCLLLEAFKIVQSKMPCRLVIIGDGPERGNLAEKARNLGVADSILFVGHQDNPYKYFGNSDLFVLTSLWEGFPNVILEAMSCGLPVVSTDCPTGPSELISDGENGFLVPLNDSVRLAEAVCAVLSSKSLREKMSRSALESSNKFPISGMIEQYDAAFHSAVMDVR